LLAISLRKWSEWRACSRTGAKAGGVKGGERGVERYTWRSEKWRLELNDSYSDSWVVTSALRGIECWTWR
jgi:hypothetical protein